MKKLLIALVVAGMSVNAMAQTEEYPVRKHSVETNSFWSNWFVSLGGGVQVMPFDRGENGVDLFETLTPNFSVSLGKWFTPGLGLRLQSHFPFYKNELGEQNKAYALYGEAMFNLTNMFCGYKQDRLYNAVPYIGFGRLWGNVQGWTPWTVGYLSTFRLTDSWSIDLDLFVKQYNIVSVVSGNRNWQAGASLGLSWHIGGRGFDASPDMPALTAMHAAQLASLNEALSAEQNENKNLKEQLAKKPKEVIKEKVVKEVLTAPQSVFFAFNSAKIASKKEIINLEALANMAKNNGAKLKVTGYADSATGSAAYNQQLSERRAQAVAKELVKLGVAEESIIVEGKGGVAEVKPASYNRRAIIEAL